MPPGQKTLEPAANPIELRGSRDGMEALFLERSRGPRHAARFGHQDDVARIGNAFH